MDSFVLMLELFNGPVLDPCDRNKPSYLMVCVKLGVGGGRQGKVRETALKLEAKVIRVMKPFEELCPFLVIFRLVRHQS